MTDASIRVLILALPETAGSALYGMVDVLSAAGNIWQTLVATEVPRQLFDVQVVSLHRDAFHCGNGIPVTPACSIAENPPADLVILPEIWLGPDECIRGRYPELMEWLRGMYRGGACVYSACSGSVLLAESGLLDRCEATSHWGYQELFRTQYPQIRFVPESNLVFADPAGRIITAGGTTSWHDLAIHIIARYAGTGEALRIAKVYLLKWHSEGQLPYAALVRKSPHADAVVRRCEQWLSENCLDPCAIAHLLSRIDVPERTLKRRFKAATGTSLIEYIQNLRIEEAKRLLEEGEMPVEEVSSAVSYEDASFFRRLFKRLTGLTPAQYRRMFRPVVEKMENAKAERVGTNSALGMRP